MASSATDRSAPNENDLKALRFLKKRKVDLTTFLDDSFKPREPPNQALPFHWLREDQPETRILEPNEYPVSILTKIYQLVKKAASIEDAQDAVRAAVALRKGSVAAVSSVVQVLPRDMDAAIRDVKAKPADETKGVKRAADTAGPEPQTAKRANLGDHNASNDAAADPVRPDIISRIQDVPEPLDLLFNRLKKMKKSPSSYLTPAVSAYFNPNQTESELYALFLTATTELREDDGPYEHLGLKEQLFLHAEKHWYFKRSVDKASQIYDNMHKDQGITLSDELEELLQEPLPCCPGEEAAGEQIAQPPDHSQCAST
ncbi:uncharacterized protein BKA78DRAFT_377777 [Phyllosticta capitalensis]|uniref:uncharacterized protein n=1 Tax=Phyllosticta capitalensis TaxID=121624 RepID=UPI00312F1B5F